MKMKFRLFGLLLTTVLWSLSFQSCTESNSSNSESEDSSATMADSTNVTSKGGTEMSVEEQLAYAKQHAKDLEHVYSRRKEIDNEKVIKKDLFNFECTNGKITLERIYNEDNEIHLLVYSICNDQGCSTKHHYFENNKLFYQFHHHEQDQGDKHMVDDHRTYFKDGEIVRCLEKRYSYNKGEAHTDTGEFKQVDCLAADKITKDIEKLLTLAEADAKALLCK